MNLILAYGYFGFRELPGIEYFNGVRAYLEKQFGAAVVVPEVSPVAGVDTRGRQLQRQIRIALGEIEPGDREAGNEEQREIAGRLDPDQPTHIIAHSMGSLDARFALSAANPDSLGDRVASLTTLGGPHRGSPTADLVWSLLQGERLSSGERRVARAVRRTLELLDISTQGLANLTTSWTARFNRTYVDHPDVRYLSAAGGGRPEERPTSRLLYGSWKWVHKITGEANDGLIPVSSARWGRFDPDLWPTDHAGLIGHDLDRCGRMPEGFDFLERWGGLVEELRSST